MPQSNSVEPTRKACFFIVFCILRCEVYLDDPRKLVNASKWVKTYKTYMGFISHACTIFPGINLNQKNELVVQKQKTYIYSPRNVNPAFVARSNGFSFKVLPLGCPAISALDPYLRSRLPVARPAKCPLLEIAASPAKNSSSSKGFAGCGVLVLKNTRTTNHTNSFGAPRAKSFQTRMSNAASSGTAWCMASPQQLRAAGSQNSCNGKSCLDLLTYFPRSEQIC